MYLQCLFENVTVLKEDASLVIDKIDQIINEIDVVDKRLKEYEDNLIIVKPFVDKYFKLETYSNLINLSETKLAE